MGLEGLEVLIDSRLEVRRHERISTSKWTG